MARSVSVLSYQKKCIILLFRKNISATKNQSICRKYRYKSICITTQLTTSYWFHSLLCYCIYYMRKYLIHVTWAQSKTPNTLCITWGSKLSFITLNSDAKYAKNWLVIWEMTWRIWRNFNRALKNVKIGTLLESFGPK